MHIINEAQRRAIIEVVQAAGEMLEVMDAAPANEFDAEWIEAVRDSIDSVSLLVRSNHIYVTSKEN